jgi:hypothetical protein
VGSVLDGELTAAASKTQTGAFFQIDLAAPTGAEVVASIPCRGRIAERGNFGKKPGNPGKKNTRWAADFFLFF